MRENKMAGNVACKGKKKKKSHLNTKTHLEGGKKKMTVPIKAEHQAANERRLTGGDICK